MSYTKYTTEALVVGRYSEGEGNATIVLLTRDFGLLSAFAQSIRFERSRIRYSVQTGMYVDASLVRGKYEWRMVSARERELLTIETGKARLHRARMLLLLRRLVKGQEQNTALFHALYSSLFYAATVAVTDKDWRALEALCAARMITFLGYLSAHELNTLDPQFGGTDFTTEVVEQAAVKLPQLVAMINRALAASQL